MPGDAYPRDFSPDGKYLVFSLGSTPYDLWTLDLESGDPPRPYLDADWNENRAQVSPDGRWLAYSSNETGTDQIYVRSFPEPGSRIDISEPGASASDVFWAPDGNVIYYGQNGILKAADVGLEDGTLAVTGRREVGPYAGVVRDIHPDGDRFLLFSLGDASTATPTRLVVIANWFSELKARLGEGN
jgi:dipeptidyl aminopeptidase/acylaminoacyl peptidase